MVGEGVTALWPFIGIFLSPKLKSSGVGEVVSFDQMNSVFWV
jgi:hypothetical protein